MHWMLSYPKPGFLRGSKTTLECYDDGKLINHGSIKLRLQHYSEKSFQDHSFYVVETKTLKPIIIGHPVSIRLGLIWVLCKNTSKSVLVIEKTEGSSKNSFQDHQLNIDGNTPCKWQRSKSESSLDHTQNSFQDHGKKCQGQDSFKTIHQKPGKSVLSRPSTNCAKNRPKANSFKTIMSQNVPKKVLSRPVRMDPKMTLLSRPWVKMTKNQLLSRPLQIELKTLTLITWSPLMRQVKSFQIPRPQRRHNQWQNSHPTVHLLQDQDSTPSMWSQDQCPSTVPGIFKHCSPTVLTA